MLVISKYSFNTPGLDLPSISTSKAEPRTGPRAGRHGGVAGGAATLNDYSRVTRARIPYVVAAITLATFLVLVLVLRAIPLAAIAVGLNLATVGVAFGILTLLFNVPSGLAAGRPQIRRRGRGDDDLRRRIRALDRLRGLPADPDARSDMTATATTPPRSDFGLEKTARVITGAAAIMMAVFIAFAGGADRDREPARNRPDRRGAARRHGCAHRLAAGSDAADRRAGLVVAAQPWTAPCRSSTSELGSRSASASGSQMSTGQAAALQLPRRFRCEPLAFDAVDFGASEAGHPSAQPRPDLLLVGICSEHRPASPSPAASRGRKAPKRVDFQLSPRVGILLAGHGSDTIPAAVLPGRRPRNRKRRPVAAKPLGEEKSPATSRGFTPARFAVIAALVFVVIALASCSSAAAAATSTTSSSRTRVSSCPTTRS